MKGRAKPIEIYELLCRNGEMTEKMKAQIDSFAAAREIYIARKWEPAHEALKAHLEKYPADGAAKTLFERTEKYLRTPPPSYWDGICDFESK